MEPYQARRNDMSKRRRINPAAYLKSYRPLTNGLDPKVVGLRGNAHKRDRELVALVQNPKVTEFAIHKVAQV